MIVLTGFAFLAGIITILSPCILPLLPIILSGSASGGKARPWGIISGFIVSFTAFTLGLSALVLATGVSGDTMRLVAASLILLFGLVLIIPPLKNAFMSLTSRLSNRQTSSAPGKQSGGYGSGLVIGFSLGLIWTPCAGPIMASVATLALSQTVSLQSVIITLAYTLGTSIPMLAIMLGGRKLMNRFPIFTQHAEAVQRIFGIIMLLTAGALFFGIDRSIQTWLLETFPSYGAGLTSVEDTQAVREALEQVSQ